MPYLGVDLSSRYARAVRPNDVCGLELLDSGRMSVCFWEWYWEPPSCTLDVEPLMDEIGAARGVLVDGPQALAAPGNTVRASERVCRTAARTPDQRPSGRAPYVGFVCSALELFAALCARGVVLPPAPDGARVGEYYPGDAWRRLTGQRMRPKHTRQGRAARAEVLRELGVELTAEASASHDRLDACLGAVLAAAGDGVVPGLQTRGEGEPLWVDRDGQLREGPIVVPAAALA